MLFLKRSIRFSCLEMRKYVFFPLLFPKAAVLDCIVCRLTFQNAFFNLKGATGGFKKGMDFKIAVAGRKSHLMKEDSQFAF